MLEKTKFLAVAAVLAVLALASAPKAHADQIYVCQSCTSAPGGDPNILTNTASFNVGVDGSATLEDPLLVIIGVYDGTSSTTAPTVSYSGCATPSHCSLASVGTYGLTADQAEFTSGTAFAALGLSAGGSESFGNWACGGSGCPGTGGDASLGLDPTSFELFAFALPVELTPSPISIDVSGAPRGSYIIAYSCKDGDGTSEGCSKPGDIAQTVYTNTGLVDNKVPEPSALALLLVGLSGLLAFVGFTRRSQAFMRPL